LVITIDDLHWGDEDSAALLAELLRPSDPPSILLVGSYRTDEVESSPLLRRLDELFKSELSSLDVRILELDVLEEEGATSLARQLLKELGQDAASAPALAHESQGSPLLLHELVRYVRTSSAPKLELVLRDRVEKLEPTPRALLEAVAVADRPVPKDVASRAAGVEASLQPTLDMLEKERLLRVRVLDRGGATQLETYHDRIREAVIEALSPARLVEVHRRLAAAMETVHLDPERIAGHLGASGDPARAAAYMEAAARQAGEALAFEREARLYRETLDLHARAGSSGENERRLETLLGEALAKAGRCAQAADAFLKAAETASKGDALQLRRRAAEELLVSGHIDRGKAIIEDVLSSLDIRMPRGLNTSLLSFAMARARLSVRGMDFELRDASLVPEIERLRLDALAGAMLGLNVIEPVLCAALHTQWLLRALRAGEPSRLSMALAAESCILAYRRGTRAASDSRRLLSSARELARVAKRPDGWAFLSTVEATVALFEGRWRDAHDRAVRAEVELRESGQGASIDRQATLLRFTALYWMGRSGDVARELKPVIRSLEERGNVLQWLWLSAYQCGVLLSQGRVPEGREMAEEVVARWPAKGFQIQHWWKAAAEIHFDLFEDKPEAAWSALNSVWPVLNRSLLLWGQLQQIEVHWLRARAAIAFASTDHPKARERLADAVRSIRHIEREGTAWGNALALTLRASVASIEGDRQQAISLLATAEPMLETHALEAVFASARRARGTCLGGDEGASLMRASDAWMTAQQVASPERWARLFVPGKW
jgi:hypothetical protein